MSFYSLDPEDQKPFIKKEKELTARSKELVDEVAKNHPFPYGFPQVGGLIAILGPGAVAVLQFLVAFSTSSEECYHTSDADLPDVNVNDTQLSWTTPPPEERSHSFLIFGWLWCLVTVSSLCHCRAFRRFDQRMTGFDWAHYWCIAVPGVVIHIGTCLALWRLSCKSYQKYERAVVPLNLVSAVFGTYAFLLPMLRVMHLDMHTASQLIQGWKSEVEKLVQAMEDGSEFGKGMDLIDDYRATRACINFNGIRKPWAGLNCIPWLQSISLGIFTWVAVLFYYVNHGLDRGEEDMSKGLGIGVVVGLLLVASLLIFLPLFLLESITSPMRAILDRMRKVKLHREIEIHGETLRTYKFLLSVLHGEPMKICLLKIPALGISLDADRRSIMKALSLLVFKMPIVLATLKYLTGKK